ncbi:MAG TPA: hypothetical protein VIJ79_13395 [Acidobacteriaceae bacterium]
MAGRGGIRKGAGRKSKASKLIEAGFVASWFTAEFQEIKWKSFLDSEDERIALDATKYLSDRLYGKASQALEHTGTGGGPIPIQTAITVEFVRPKV